MTDSEVFGSQGSEELFWVSSFSSLSISISAMLSLATIPTLRKNAHISLTRSQGYIMPCLLASIEPLGRTTGVEDSLVDLELQHGYSLS